MVARLALDAMVWTGEGSPTLEQRRKKLPEYQASNRRPIDRAFVNSIFSRDRHGVAEEKVIEAFADAIIALDDSVPTGTYVDMCSRLPVVDPEKITVPTIIMRGQWDGIASMEDLIKFFAKLPNPDKHFAVMPGISHASFKQKNYKLVYHILTASSRSRSRSTGADEARVPRCHRHARWRRNGDRRLSTDRIDGVDCARNDTRRLE